MTTFFDLILDLAQTITDVAESTATGGGATSLIDSLRDEPDDYFTSGTIFFTDGANAGISRPISAYVLSSTTFSFTALGTAVTAGDGYSAAPVDYPRYILRQAINRAMRELGNVDYFDETLVTVANQQEYSLPAGVVNVKRVEIAINSIAPLGYAKHLGWEELDGKIRFFDGREPDDDGYPMRLTYQPAVDLLTADDDLIDDRFPLETIRWVAAVHALRWKVRRVGTDEPEYINLLNEALQNAEKNKGAHPVPRLARDIRSAGW